MNKRILAFLLTLALALSMIVVPAQAKKAISADVTAPEDACPCGCGKSLDDVTWMPWAVNGSEELSSGHYYLEGDYAQDEQKTIISGDQVVLDLRGHTLTTEGYGRLFLLYGYLAVIDTVGGGVFSSKTSGGSIGGIVSIATNESNDPTLELYSGTIMPDPDNKGALRGGLIHLGENGTFRMYGGRLMNGKANAGYPGGSIGGAYASCRIEILGGEILGSTAATNGGALYNLGTTILKNCRIVGGTAGGYGGNVAQNSGTLTIENCIIESGSANGANHGGGNVCAIGGAAVTIKDSILRNGFSATYGGNLALGTSATCTMENTQLLSGVAQSYGNNFYGSTTVKGLTIRDCEIPGDVMYVGKKLNLEGVVKIGLLNNGLILRKGTTAIKADASGLAEGSEIYVDADGTFTNAGANAAYFKGAMRTVITESTDGLVATQAAAGELGGYCPHCNEQVVWYGFGTGVMLVQNCYMDSATDTDPKCSGLHLESGHYYMTADKTSMSMYYVGVYLSGTKAVKDVVLDLAGYDAVAFGRAFFIRPDDAEGNNNQLTILDSVGGGNVQGSGSTSKQGGGVIYNDGGILNIYGGTHSYVYTNRVVFNGGVIYNADTVNIYGGVIDGSNYFVPETDPDTTNTISYKGGAYYQATGKTLNVTAGRFLGGTAWTGGNVYAAGDGNIQVTGGQFVGGTAIATEGDIGGGNIRLYGTSTNKKGTASFENCLITDGNLDVSVGGGNLSALYYGVDLTNCYVANGTVGGSGGNITAGTASTINATNTIIAGGTANTNAGNIHAATTTSRTTLTNCLVTCGTSKEYGGNINSGAGYMTIRGGEVSFGVSTNSFGGNIRAGAGNYNATTAHNTRIEADDQGNIPLIAGGTAKNYGGNIFLAGVLYLDAARIQSGSAGTSGQDISYSKASNQNKLQIGSGVVGDISISVASAHLGEGVYGQSIAYTLCDTLNATLTLEGNYGSPYLCAKDGVLYVGAISVIDAAGNMSWYADTAAAVEACNDDSYMKLYADLDVVLTKDCAVDINGNTVNVSGAYTLRGMDSSGNDFTEPAGTANIAPETTVLSDYTAPNGNRYLYLNGDFHRVELRLTDVALRPSANGLYYTGVWSADETVLAKIENYGIAVSTVNAPGADFAADEDTLYTVNDSSSLVNGEKKTGALVAGILKTDRSAELNNAYGQMPVFAGAYITFTDGTVLMSDDLAMSLQDIMQMVDELIVTDPQHYRRLTLPLREFYEKWDEQIMDTWQLSKIPEPEDDGYFNILMIGNSFCSYYVQELWALGQAAGINMRVCNVYYSGCRLSKHYQWWLTGEANYVFHTTTSPERVSVTSKNLEWCLGQYEWDVISIQEGSGVWRVGNTSYAPEEAYNNHKEAYENLIPYLRSQFPNAELYWHQTWAYQVGFKRDGDSYTVPDKETQDKSYTVQKEYADLVCGLYDMPRVPSGEAWKIIRDNGYDQLCARLGRDFYGQVNGGDYYHDGDIGGGQYLNACVWFEVLTGQSCIGIGYEPTYIHNGVTYGLNEGITARELQEAAHAAVAMFYEER